MAARGWVEYPEGQAREVETLLEDSVVRALEEGGLTLDEAELLREAWILPELLLPTRTRAPFWTYLFLGADLPRRCGPVLEAQVIALAGRCAQDGVLTHWTEGVLHVEDDGGDWATEWRIAEGTVRTEEPGSGAS